MYKTSTSGFWRCWVTVAQQKVTGSKCFRSTQTGTKDYACRTAAIWGGPERKGLHWTKDRPWDRGFLGEQQLERPLEKHLATEKNSKLMPRWHVLSSMIYNWCLTPIKWRRGLILRRVVPRGSHALTFLVPENHTTQYGVVQSTALHFLGVQECCKHFK